MLGVIIMLLVLKLIYPAGLNKSNQSINKHIVCWLSDFVLKKIVCHRRSLQSKFQTVPNFVSNFIKKIPEKIKIVICTPNCFTNLKKKLI